MKFLLRKLGDRKWDIFLRMTGLMGLIGIPIAHFFPEQIPLVWLSIVGVPANSPLGPILPTAFEPFIMEAAKYHSPVSVTFVATAIYMYMEFVNWHVYKWVLERERFEKLPENKWVDWGIRNFQKRPITTIIFFAVTPLPFWIVRCLALLNKYPIRPFMIATAIGRWPRLFLYAWLGELLLVPTPILVGIAFGTGALVITVRWLQGKKLLEGTVLDRAG